MRATRRDPGRRVAPLLLAGAACAQSPATRCRRGAWMLGARRGKWTTNRTIVCSARSVRGRRLEHVAHVRGGAELSRQPTADIDADTLVAWPSTTASSTSVFTLEARALGRSRSARDEDWRAPSTSIPTDGASASRYERATSRSRSRSTGPLRRPLRRTAQLSGDRRWRRCARRSRRRAGSSTSGSPSTTTTAISTLLPRIDSSESAEHLDVDAGEQLPRSRALCRVRARIRREVC